MITDTGLFAAYLPEHSYTPAQVQSAIDAANQIVESYCGRVFSLSDYTEWHYVEDTSRIFLDRYPVTAITSIATADKEDGAATAYTDYRAKRPSGLIILPCDMTTWFKVVYSAGYTFIPADVVLTANEVAKSILDNSGKDSVLTEEKIDDYSYKLASATDKDPMLRILSRVNSYRKQQI
jgi:hypothetical protein